MIVCVIQARMGSTRLPGKVLMPVNGEKSILEMLVERISVAPGLDRIIIATSTNAEDDQLEAFCHNHHYLIHRGSDWDVLTRFYGAAVQAGAKSGDHVIRICADNPLSSAETVQFVIEKYLHSKLDYFSNTNEPPYLEDGFDVEIFSFNALHIAFEKAELLSQREHVTPFIKNSGLFTCGWQKHNDQYTHKLSVDTAEDLELSKAIFSALQVKPQFTIHDVVDLLQEKPELLEINKSSEINSGYAKSLREDKKIEKSS
ncbi:MAG: cytidylyltransferase domain-containing protein [Flavobacteriales bacterium]